MENETEASWQLARGMLYTRKITLKNGTRRCEGCCVADVSDSIDADYLCISLPGCSVAGLPAHWIKVLPVIQRIRHPSKL